MLVSFDIMFFQAPPETSKNGSVSLAIPMLFLVSPNTRDISRYYGWSSLNLRNISINMMLNLVDFFGFGEILSSLHPDFLV